VTIKPEALQGYPNDLPDLARLRPPEGTAEQKESLHQVP